MPKIFQKPGTLLEGHGSLSDFEMFVLFPMIVVEVNVLEPRAKGVDAGLNAAVDVGMPGI